MVYLFYSRTKFQVVIESLLTNNLVGGGDAIKSFTFWQKFWRIQFLLISTPVHAPTISKRRSIVNSKKKEKRKHCWEKTRNFRGNIIISVIVTQFNKVYLARSMGIHPMRGDFTVTWVVQYVARTSRIWCFFIILSPNLFRFCISMLTRPIILFGK